MYHVKKVHKQAGLREFLRGTEISRGNTVTTAEGSPTFTDLNADFVTAGVAAGDQVCLSGDGTTYVVQTRDSATVLTLDSNVGTANTADGHWRIFRGGVDPADVIFSPIEDGLGDFYVIYDEVDFQNP
jgi:hypothetical protein